MPGVEHGGAEHGGAARPRSVPRPAPHHVHAALALAIVLALLAALTASGKVQSRDEGAGAPGTSAATVPGSSASTDGSATPPPGEGTTAGTVGGDPIGSAGAAPPVTDVGRPPVDRRAVARYPGQPLYTKLRLTLDSQVAWAAADLIGIGYVTGQVVQGGSAVDVLPDGIALRGPGRGVVDAVFTLPERDVEARLCKASGGTATLSVVRLTSGASPVGTVVATANDDQLVDGCANRGVASLPAAALAPEGSWPAPVDDRRLVLSFFYPWWTSRSFDSNPYLDIPLPPFDTVSDASLDAIIDKAKAAGVDGFVESYQQALVFSGRFAQLVRRAEADGDFTVAPQLELVYLTQVASTAASRAAALESWFRDVLASAASPAFLKVGGRPVVFLFRTDLLDPAILGAVRTSLRASGLDPYVIGDALDPAYALDGFYTYTPNVVADAAGLPDWYWQLARTTRFEADRGLGDRPALLVSPVSPGENDARAGGGSLGLVVDRGSGARYDASWAAAVATRPDWVVVSSWNALPEDTQITPSQVHGQRALDQTAAWAQLFHTG